VHPVQVSDSSLQIEQVKESVHSKQLSEHSWKK